MLKNIGLGILFLLGAVLHAAPPQKYTAEETKWLKNGLSPDVVMGKISQFAREFSEGKDGMPLPVSAGRIYTRIAQRYQQYYFFEHDTKFDARWLASAIKYMEALVNARHQMDILEGANKKDTPEYKQWVDYYQKTAAGLLQGVKKPGKVTDADKLKRLGKEKQDVVSALQKAEQRQKPPPRQQQRPPARPR